MTEQDPTRTREVPVSDPEGKEGLKLRIIIADDEPLNAGLAKRYLEKKGYTVHIVESGEKLLEELKTGGYNFVMTDLQMPKMTGIDLLTIIRADNDFGKIPVVVYSGTGGVNREKVNGLGGTYMAKPFSREQLTVAVAEALAKVST